MKKSEIKYLALICFLTACAACGRQDAPRQDSAPAQRGYNIILRESTAGQTAWRLEVKETDFFDDDQYLTLKNPSLILNENGQKSSTVTSLKGRYDIAKHLITLSKKVTGVSQKENAKIETEEIFYDTQTKEIWSDSPVKLTRGKITVNGAGLRANGDLSQIEIIKQKTALPADIKDIKQAAK